jgi:hypothetical protein
MSDGTPHVEGDAHAAFGFAVPDEHGAESGVAAHWLWDGERLEVRSDRHGYVPLYYHHDERESGFTVSDSPLALIASGIHAEFDPESLAFFCRAGFLLGDRTLYRDIHRVPPGGLVRWDAGVLSIEREEERFLVDSPSSIDEAIDGWIDRFRSSMLRRQPMDGSFGMPLSGGRDSRMMLMELRALGHHPSEVVSFGPGARGENEDLRIARTIADRLGLRHEIARSRKGWHHTEHERHAWCGCEALEHAWLIGLWSHFRARHRCWYDGLGAGAMTRGELNTPVMLDLLRRDDLHGWCDAMYAETAAPPEAWVVRIIEAMGLDLPDRGDVVDFVATELTDHRDTPNPLARFAFCNWGRRAIALNPYGICRNIPEIHTPFMDRDLVDWVASVPAEWTFDDDLQTSASLRMHPELADIGFDGHQRATGHRSGIRRRIGNRLERYRFFSGPGIAFRGLAAEAMRASRSDPGANRALMLMVHLVLADASRSPDRARELLGYAAHSDMDFTLHPGSTP